MEEIKENVKDEQKMAPPWVQYANALHAMFGKDKEIRVQYDNDNKEVKLFVDNPVKANALQQLLPVTVVFGSVVLKVTIVPADEKMSQAQLYRAAFSGNPVFVEAVPMEGVFTNPLLYIVFKKEVVQYYNDNLADLHGNRSTLYETIAGEIFKEHEGVLYCTDSEMMF